MSGPGRGEVIYGSAVASLCAVGGVEDRSSFTVTMEAAGDKIRSNSQGWENMRVIGERQVLMVCPSIGRPSSRTSPGRPTRGARGLRMSDASTGSERATGDASTPLEERAFGEAGSSFEAHARLR